PRVDHLFRLVDWVTCLINILRVIIGLGCLDHAFPIFIDLVVRKQRKDSQITNLTSDTSTKIIASWILVI
ncbi:MAG: hypothetical protein EBZ82_06080, partial [Burkholderiaceae bacterium]|nr:hypothetical protein [Burkholderiaceae bacterium]